MGFQLKQKLMTLNDLERHSLLCHQCYAYCDQTTVARITQILYNLQCTQYTAIFRLIIASVLKRCLRKFDLSF